MGRHAEEDLTKMEDKRADSALFSDNPQLRGKVLIWRLWVPIWVLVLLAAIGGLGLAAKPAYRAYRAYRINQNLEAAKAADRVNDWGTARDKARSVLLARQQDFEAYRIWVRALGKLREPGAAMASAGLFGDPRASRDDRLEMLRVLAVQAPQALALRAYASLPDELHKQADFSAAITPLLVQRGEFAFAEKSLREVLQPQAGPKARLELLRTLCHRPDVWRMAEARRILADLIAAKADAEALDALLLLADIPNALAPGLALPDLPGWLKTQPQATAIHHLVAMHPALEADPASAPRLYAMAIERFATTDPTVLGNWLARHNQAEKAAEILKEPAATRSDAYIARVQILLRLSRAEEIDAMLVAPPAAVDAVDVEIAQAHLAWLRGKPAAAEAALTRAMNRAAFDTKHNRFMEIARIAQSNGARDAAIDAWVAAVRLGWGQVPLYNDLLPVINALAAKGRSEDLLAMCRTLLHFEPFHTDLRNNFYYLALIHGLLPADKVATTTAQLLAENPKRPGFNSTLMLAEMLGGRPADALSHLSDLHQCKDVDPMMQSALEGSARVLVGETATGTALLREVRWERLMRQERLVFRDLLVKLKIAAIPLPEIKSDPMAAAPDQIPAWRKAMENLENDRSAAPLPALHTPKSDIHPDQNPAWRKAVEQRQNDQSSDILPALPAPHVHGSEPPKP